MAISQIMSTTDMPSIGSYKMIEIDEQGDVLVCCERIGADGCEADEKAPFLGVLKVSSKALSLASPVFKAMFDPKREFKESKVEGEHGLRELNILVESLDSALLVMRTLHYQNKQNPKVITLEQLHELACFADRYMCQEALSMAATAWSTPLLVGRHRVKDDVCVRLLWIAKVFEQREVLVRSAYGSVFHCKTVEGSFMIHNVVSTPAMGGFAKGIWEVREKLLKILTEFIEEKILEFESSFKLKDSWMDQKDKVEGADIYPSECHMTNIAPMYTLRALMGYPNYNVDHLSLLRICNLSSNIGKTGQSITFCRRGNSGYSNQSQCTIKTSCNQSQKLSELVTSITNMDTSDDVLKAAGII